MKKKLNCVLLIDDDFATNFINKTIINKEGVAEHIQVVLNGKEALDYITNQGKFESEESFPKPQLVFLDINMPVMDGWEFIQEYQKLSPEIKENIIIVMLTSSLNPDDKSKADTFAEIADFRNKILTVEVLKNVLAKHFPDYI